VIINQCWYTATDEYLEPVSPSLNDIISNCPTEIKISVFVLEKSPPIDANSQALPANKWQRAFYRRTTEGGWARTRIEEHHTAILMPAKQFNGRVGEFLKVAYKLSMLKLQERAVGPLMLEAIDRHHFNDGKNDAFSCPVHGCSAFFSRAGEWTDHAIERHPNMCDLSNVASYLKQWRAGGQNNILSEELRVGFEQRTIDLHNRRNELEGQTFRYAVDWAGMASSASGWSNWRLIPCGLQRAMERTTKSGRPLLTS
jgi:hypothetical protein